MEIIKKCENCGNYIDVIFGTGRFCCKGCACAFSTKNDDNNQTKLCNCTKCGKQIEIKKRASIKNALCNQCKHTFLKKYVIDDGQKKINYIKKIKVCKLTSYTIDYCEKCKLKHIGLCKSINKMNQSIKPLSILNLKYIGTPNVIDEILEQKHILEDLYLNQKLSGADINQLYNGYRTEYLIHNIFGIPRRTLKDAVKNAVYSGKFGGETCSARYQFKTEWHTTWDDKIVYLRSSYEIDYANELDSKKIKYDVEKLRIKYFDTSKNEYRCAIPDFYLEDTNTIVEVKSTYTLNIQEMKDKVQEYKKLGFNFKLILEHKEEDLNKIQIENRQIIYI